MTNLLQSSQTQATSAPQFYSDYLSNLASAGQTAQQQAQYVGAQPLQQQAFSQIGQTAGAFQPAISQGEQLVGQAAGQDITGAAQPYLQAGTAVNPITAMQPYAQQATGFTGYEASLPLVGQGAGTSGLSAASPFLGRAANTSSEIGRAHV